MPNQYCHTGTFTRRTALHNCTAATKGHGVGVDRMSEVFAVIPPTQDVFEQEWVWTDDGEVRGDGDKRDGHDARTSRAGGTAVATRSPLKRRGAASDVAPSVVLFDSIGCVGFCFV